MKCIVTLVKVVEMYSILKSWIAIGYRDMNVELDKKSNFKQISF